MTMQQLLFDFEGRIPRQWFILAFLFLLCLQFSTSIVLMHMMEISPEAAWNKITREKLGFELIANAPFIWPNVAIGVKRLHDIGWFGAGYVFVYVGLMVLYLLGFLGAFSDQPGENASFWQFVMMFGFASFILLILMVFVPGSKGDNRFGPQP